MTDTHTIESLCLRSHEISKSKGWLENPRPFSAICSLIHSEISEALEEFRNNKKLDETFYEAEFEDVSDSKRSFKLTLPKAQLNEEGFKKIFAQMEPPPKLVSAKPCGIPIELADVIIRVAQWCGTNGFAEELQRLVQDREEHTKWFERYIADFEGFSAMAHARTSKAFLAWDDGSPEAQYSESLALAPLADLTHLCFTFSRVNNIDLWAAIDEKEAFNKTRPHKHGGKRI